MQAFLLYNLLLTRDKSETHTYTFRVYKESTGLAIKLGELTMPISQVPSNTAGSTEGSPWRDSNLRLPHGNWVH